MSTRYEGADHIPEDDLIAQLGTLFNKIRATEFPALVKERVTDDGETFDALRCPRCGNLVESEDLYAVDFSERWNNAGEIGDEDFVHGSVIFYPGDTDYGSTLYYLHDDHAVSLPDGWVEEWV